MRSRSLWHRSWSNTEFCDLLHSWWTWWRNRTHTYSVQKWKFVSMQYLSELSKCISHISLQSAITGWWGWCVVCCECKYNYRVQCLWDYKFMKICYPHFDTILEDKSDYDKIYVFFSSRQCSNQHSTQFHALFIQCFWWQCNKHRTVASSSARFELVQSP